MSIRAEFGSLLRALRGPYRPTDVARALGRTRQAVDGLENRAEVSMTRMEWLEEFYGVDFHVIAVDRTTGTVYTPDDVFERPAVMALVQRIEGNAPPALMPDARRKVETGTATPAAATQSAGDRGRRAG